MNRPRDKPRLFAKSRILKRARRWELLGPLQSPDFVRLSLSNGLWWQAMWMEQLVLGWLALSLTDSAWWVALIGFFRTVPQLLLGLFTGPVADRFNRRRLIVVLQGATAAATGVLTLLLALGVLAYWHVALVALANGTAWALDWPARRSLVPDLVGRRRVVEAMVLENLLQSVGRITGPLAAGATLAMWGMLGALSALTSMGLVSLLFLAGLETNSRAPAVPAGIRASWQRVTAGLRYVYRQPPIVGVLLTTVAMNAWAFPHTSLLPVFARDVLGQGPLGLGILGSAHGIGALLGLVLVGSVRSRLPKERLFGGGSVLTCLAVAIFAFTRSYHLAVAMLVVAGIGQAGFSIMQSSIILVEAPDEMRGRAMGALVLAIGAGPLGRLQCGAMAAAWGAPLAAGSMAGMAGVAIIGICLLVRGFAFGGRTPGGTSAGVDAETGARAEAAAPGDGKVRERPRDGRPGSDGAEDA